MKVVRHMDAEAFIRRAGEWLSAREAEHNTILGDAHLLLTKDRPFREPIYLASIEDGSRILGCAARPPPGGLTLTSIRA